MPKIMKNGVEYGGNTGGLVSSAFLAERAALDQNGDSIKDTYVKVADSSAAGISDTEMMNAAYHNSLFRGKNIGTYFADGSLYTRISSGSFADLFVGDYFDATINGSVVRCRIAGFDVYWNDGDTALTRHHAVIVPDGKLTDAVMNSSNTTLNGYQGSAMHGTTMTTINGWLEATFGEHLLQFRDLFSKTVGSSMCQGYSGYTGQASGWDWYNSKADLMSEVEVYGAAICGSSGYDVCCGRNQLPLFALAPEFITTRFPWWLRAVVSSADFARVSAGGSAGVTGAGTSFGVRPRWLIG